MQKWEPAVSSSMIKPGIDLYYDLEQVKILYFPSQSLELKQSKYP